MLPRQNRLKGVKNFKEVQKKGKVINSNSFGLAYLKREDENPSRFGFIISTKISKLATLRNRARRALGEKIRQSTRNIKDGYDCIFLAKPPILKTYTQDLMKEVEVVLTKAKIYK